MAQPRHIWEDEVYEAMQDYGVDRSDAQGIADAHSDELDRQWAKKANPTAAAAALMA